MNNKRIIAKIFNGEEVLMTIDRNMLSCEFGALDRGNLTDVVNWGIYANRGSISFIDNIGYFNNKNVNSAEVKGYTVRFYLTKEQQTLIATFKIDNVDFEEETRKVNIELISPIMSLSTEKITSSVYPFYMRRVIELLEDINDKSPYTKISIGEDSNNINYTTIGTPYIGVDTIWNVMTKICQATMSRVIEKPDGDLEITSSFPQKTPIIVKPKNIINIDNADFVRIENATIEVTERQSLKNWISDGSSKSFNVERDESLYFTGISGFELTDSSNNSYEGGFYEEYVQGILNLETPYKIFSVDFDRSVVTERLQIGDLSSSAVIKEDSEYTRNTVLCSNSSIVNETTISAKINSLRVTHIDHNPEVNFTYVLTKGGEIRFPISTFVDKGTKTISITDDKNGEKIESNDLIQYNSFFNGDVGIRLGEYILNEVKKRYSNGIECFEIECLFNDYYDENGNKVFSKDDLSVHFNKYDIIIPYVIKKGKEVPLRVNEDGTPKKFRIIGISYSYDGLLKQKLSIQEERYDID